MKPSTPPEPQPEELARDDAILLALSRGTRSTAGLITATGMGERRIERGLRRLQDAGLVFAPVRGTYRLTPAGRAILPEQAPAPTAPVVRRQRARPAPDDDQPLDLVL